jgi:hypothetical protein
MVTQIYELHVKCQQYIETSMAMVPLLHTRALPSMRTRIKALVVVAVVIVYRLL